MSAPLVSICCITYNHAPFIRQCLDGFMMQKTSFSFEIIVHDDASTDNTAEIINEYASKDDRIKAILRKENIKSTGVAVLPIVYKEARGKYIAICEGDDYWIDPYKLQKQFDFLESHPDFSMCFHSYYEKKGEKLDLKPYTLKDELSLVDFATSIGGIQTLTVFHRNLITSTANETSQNKINFTGSYFLYAMLAKVGKLKFINEPMAVYRVHGGGLWSGKSKYQKAVMALENRAALTAFFEEDSSVYRLFRSTYIKSALSHCADFFERRNIRSGFKLLARSFRFGVTWDHLVFWFSASDREKSRIKKKDRKD